MILADMEKNTQKLQENVQLANTIKFRRRRERRRVNAATLVSYKALVVIGCQLG